MFRDLNQTLDKDNTLYVEFYKPLVIELDPRPMGAGCIGQDKCKQIRTRPPN